MPETCRVMKETEDKQCIELVFITQIYRDARSTKQKIEVISSEPFSSTCYIYFHF